MTKGAFVAELAFPVLLEERTNSGALSLAGTPGDFVALSDGCSFTLSFVFPLLTTALAVTFNVGIGTLWIVALAGVAELETSPFSAALGGFPLTLSAAFLARTLGGSGRSGVERPLHFFLNVLLALSPHFPSDKIDQPLVILVFVISGKAVPVLDVNLKFTAPAELPDHQGLQDVIINLLLLAADCQLPILEKLLQIVALQAHLEQLRDSE